MNTTRSVAPAGSSERRAAVPRLPRPLALALRIAPKAPPRHAVVFCLNRLFESALRSGELDWLQGKVASLEFEDAGNRLSLTLSPGRRLTVCSDRAVPDLVVEGVLFDFLGLAARREDSDTLFFHRRLHLKGDVELGLYLKNFLDGLEPDPTQQRVLATLQRLYGLIERTNRHR
ncbi:MAG: SCP2 sterol-binding domain-containing protein [Gammaproteobacteria bacterium]